MRGGGDKTRMGYVHHSGGFLQCVKPDWSTPGLLFDLPLDYVLLKKCLAQVDE